jgi:hypothetical protein
MSSIRMSAVFGSIGQKRMPEKVVMEPWGSIHPRNHAGYTRHNSPWLLLLSRRAHSRLFPGRPKGGVSGVVAGQGGRLFGRGRRHLALHSGCFGLRPASASAAFNLAGTGLGAPGRYFGRLSSNRGRRRRAARAPLPVRLRRSLRFRAPSPSASSRSAADVPGPPKHRAAPRGGRR